MADNPIRRNLYTSIPIFGIIDMIIIAELIDILINICSADTCINASIKYGQSLSKTSKLLIVLIIIQAIATLIF